MTSVTHIHCLVCKVPGISTAGEDNPEHTFCPDCQIKVLLGEYPELLN
jgi:hypothetical protein